MQDRFQDLRDKVKQLPGSRRKRAKMLGVDHSTLGRFEGGVSQTLATLSKIERGLRSVELLASELDR